jgi:hypothetical protein
MLRRSGPRQIVTQPTQINPRLPHFLFVVGDSTANNNANGGRGWGDPFIALFDASKINVLNRARAGRSSRTFFTEGLWDKSASRHEARRFCTYPNLDTTTAER